MACITLLSDFGLQDASVAAAKGILMQYTEGLGIVDISHEINPFNTKQAAYLLASAYKNFPQGTCHVLAFDIFYEPIPKLVLTTYNDHYFLAPDNGIIPLALPEAIERSWLLFELTKEQTFADWMARAGKAISILQTKKPEQQGLPAHKLKPSKETTVTVNDAATIACEVMHIDRYENVILNITKQQFENMGRGRRFRLEIMQVEEITEISNGYNDVREGNKLCRFNSNGYLEICVNRGNAASLFGFRLNSRYNDIKLIFE